MKSSIMLVALVAILPLVLYLGYVAFSGLDVKRIPGWFGQAGAVVNVLSSVITNRDAVPPTLNKRALAGMEMRHARAKVAIANGDSAASIYRVLEIPSNAIPISVRVSSPDIGTTTAADIGLYQTTKNGSAVAEVDVFASALALSGGALSKSEVVNEAAAVATPANSEKRIWELLGLTADSQRSYDVCLTLTGAADAAGDVLLEVDYAV